MRLIEYRIPLPFTVNGAQRGQVYAVAEASLRETGGGSGVLVLANRPFTDTPLLHGQFATGQYTHKRYHLQAKVSTFWRRIFPAAALKV